MAIQAGARTVHSLRHGLPDDGAAASPIAPPVVEDAPTQDSSKENPGA
jgi:hypothetical protein